MTLLYVYLPRQFIQNKIPNQELLYQINKRANILNDKNIQLIVINKNVITPIIEFILLLSLFELLLLNNKYLYWLRLS